MWLRAPTRERKNSLNRILRSTSRTGSKRFQHAVALQLDYYLSPQFAGVAAAIVNGTYAKHGIQQLDILPTCSVGLEQERVRKHQDQNPNDVVLGSVEQNIFIPTLHANPELKVKAVAAMFAESPLCIAHLASTGLSSGPKTIGAHEDTVELMQRIFPGNNVIASPRATKNTDLVSGKLDAIQAYTTTEIPTLRRLLDGRDDGEGIDFTMLNFNGRNHLGYSQTLFASEESLQGDRREITKSFLAATFEGWQYAIREPERGVEMVREARKIIHTNDDESNDHWFPSAEFELEMTRRCNDFVKATFQGDRYGVIDPIRWNKATRWLVHGSEDVQVDFGLDSDVWCPPKNLLAGNHLAHRTMESARALATNFEETYGRKPSLAVVTVGELSRYKFSERRRELYGNSISSWFSKTETGQANNFSVQEISLPHKTTTDELLSHVYTLQKTVDGIQLMWPLPKHIDSGKVYAAIETCKDVDGIHYIGQKEIGNENAFAPVTPAATVALLNEYGIDVKNKRVLVIGRSPIVGSPVAHMLREMGGAVTTVHSEIDASTLEDFVRQADVVVCCAGTPSLVKAEWFNSNAVVINIGTTFHESQDSLLSDVDGDLGSYASQYSPVPGGVGPLSSPLLFHNVARAAWQQMKSSGSLISSGWKKQSESLSKTFHFESYNAAVNSIVKVDNASTIMDHHANMKLTHHCVDGVDAEMALFTYEAGKLTDKDFQAAKTIDMLLDSTKGINMSDFTYNLNEESIAKFPAEPRGSSKLLRVASDGEVSYHSNFSNSFPALAEGSQVVFNESRVLQARLFVNEAGGTNKLEMMILDLGIDLGRACDSTELNVMLRKEDIKAGQVFSIETDDGKVQVEVTNVVGAWQEDETSNGNGTECFVRIQSKVSVSNFLEKVGTVPIPPYLHRAAEASDTDNYNNVYASESGSVAAPTAGLHFTDNVMLQIGKSNTSFLTLHTGAGTFQPVVAKDARDHKMHSEAFGVSVKELRGIIQALEQGKPLIVVGTTSCRTLESLFWLGVKRIRGLDKGSNNRRASDLELGQTEWLPLSVGEGSSISNVQALQALVDGLDDTDMIRGRTSLMIAPPQYDFRVVDHLVTNFHAPDSTLLLLVSAFLNDPKGDKIRTLYEDAQARGYCFLSYGDVCMFSRPGFK